MRVSRTTSFPVAALALLIALGVPLVIADARAQTASSPPRDVSARLHRVHLVSPAAGGMVVGIDPETGMLVMPEPDALARLLQAREQQARRVRPAPFQHADGSVSLDVRTWMREFLTVSTGPGGRLQVRCVSGKPAAEQALNAPAAPAVEER
jgi:hypothetical protein